MKIKTILAFAIASTMGVCGCVSALEDELVFTCSNDDDCPSGMVCVENEDYDSYCRKPEDTCQGGNCPCLWDEDCQTAYECIEDESGQSLCRSSDWCESYEDCAYDEGCDEFNAVCKQDWCDDDDDCTRGYDSSVSCDYATQTCEDDSDW
jgi:hypothetical protein